MQPLRPVGAQLREWRQRRRLSQLDLAGHAQVSTRHAASCSAVRPKRSCAFGLAPRIVNLAAWRTHLLHRLRQQVQASADAALATLAEELQGYAAPHSEQAEPLPSDGGVYVPLQLRSAAGTLNFISTVTVFGTPTDITLAELALETLFPADDETAQALRQMAGSLD